MLFHWTNVTKKKTYIFSCYKLYKCARWDASQMEEGSPWTSGLMSDLEKFKIVMKCNWIIDMILLVTWRKSSFRNACVHLLLLKKSHTFLFQKSQNISRVFCKKTNMGEIFLPSPIYHLLTMQITLFFTSTLCPRLCLHKKGGFLLRLYKNHGIFIAELNLPCKYFAKIFTLKPNRDEFHFCCKYLG